MNIRHTPDGMNNRKIPISIFVATGFSALLILGVVTVVLWWNSRTDGPAEVSLESATAELESQSDTNQQPDQPQSPTSSDHASFSNNLDASSNPETSSTDAPPLPPLPPLEEDTHFEDISETVSVSESETSDTGREASDAETSDSEDANPETPNANPDVLKVPDITGIWNVNTSFRSYDYEQGTGSFTGFRVDEELTTLGKITAVGRTGEVTGLVELSEDSLVAADITVDMKDIATDDPRRDYQIQKALKTDRFPNAVFTLNEPVPLPSDEAYSEPFSVEANGELTIAGVTNQATFHLDAQLVNDVIIIVGKSKVLFSDYGVTAPSAPVVLSVEDNGIIELQLFLTK